MNFNFDSREMSCFISYFDTLPAMPASDMSRTPSPDEYSQDQLPPTEGVYQNSCLGASEHADAAAASHDTSSPSFVSKHEVIASVTAESLAFSPTSPQLVSRIGLEHSAPEYPSPPLVPWSDCSDEKIPIEPTYSPTSPKAASHIEPIASKSPSYVYYPTSPDYRFANGIGPSSADQAPSPHDGLATPDTTPEDEEHIVTLGTAWEQYRSNEANDEEELTISWEEFRKTQVGITRWAEDVSKHILPILEDAYEVAQSHVERLCSLKRRKRTTTPNILRDTSPATKDWTDATFYHIYHSAVDLIEASLQPRGFKAQQHQPTDLPDAGLVYGMHGSSHQMPPSVTNGQRRLSGAEVILSRSDSEFKEMAKTTDGKRHLNPRSRSDATDSTRTASQMNAYILADRAIRSPKSLRGAAPPQKTPFSLARSPFTSMTPSYGKRRRSDSSSASNYRSPPIFSTPDGNARKKVKTGYAPANAIDITAADWASLVDSTENLSRHLRNTFSGINSGSNALADFRQEIGQMGCKCGCLERVRALHRTLQEKEDRMLEYVYAMDTAVAEFQVRRR